MRWLSRKARWNQRLCHTCLTIAGSWTRCLTSLSLRVISTKLKQIKLILTSKKITLLLNFLNFFFTTFLLPLSKQPLFQSCIILSLDSESWHLMFSSSAQVLLDMTINNLYSASSVLKAIPDA